MDYKFSTDDESFRGEVVGFIDDNWVPPEGTNEPGDDSYFEAERSFEKRAASKGWLTMAWPTEYGGRGPPATSSRRSTARKRPTVGRQAPAVRASRWSARV